MIKDLISVIIPHKPERELKYLDTIKFQKDVDIEIIIKVDLKKEGASVMRNKGFLEAQGEYIFPCDDDIQLKDTCLSIMKKSIELRNRPFAYCNHLRMAPLWDAHIAKPWDYEELKKCNYVSTMSLMRREIFQPFDPALKRFQDWDLWLRIGKEHAGVYVNGFLFVAHYDDDSISITPRAETIEAVKIIKEKHGL